MQRGTDGRYRALIVLAFTLVLALLLAFNANLRTSHLTQYHQIAQAPSPHNGPAPAHPRDALPSPSNDRAATADPPDGDLFPDVHATDPRNPASDAPTRESADTGSPAPDQQLATSTQTTHAISPDGDLFPNVPPAIPDVPDPPPADRSTRIAAADPPPDPAQPLPDAAYPAPTSPTANPDPSPSAATPDQQDQLASATPASTPDPADNLSDTPRPPIPTPTPSDNHTAAIPAQPQLPDIWPPLLSDNECCCNGCDSNNPNDDILVRRYDGNEAPRWKVNIKSVCCRQGRQQRLTATDNISVYESEDATTPIDLTTRVWDNGDATVWVQGDLPSVGMGDAVLGLQDTDDPTLVDTATFTVLWIDRIDIKSKSSDEFSTDNPLVPHILTGIVPQDHNLGIRRGPERIGTWVEIRGNVQPQDFAAAPFDACQDWNRKLFNGENGNEIRHTFFSITLANGKAQFNSTRGNDAPDDDMVYANPAKPNGLGKKAAGAIYMFDDPGITDVNVTKILKGQLIRNRANLYTWFRYTVNAKPVRCSPIKYWSSAISVAYNHDSMPLVVKAVQNGGSKIVFDGSPLAGWSVTGAAVSVTKGSSKGASGMVTGQGDNFLTLAISIPVASQDEVKIVTFSATDPAAICGLNNDFAGDNQVNVGDDPSVFVNLTNDLKK